MFNKEITESDKLKLIKELKNDLSNSFIKIVNLAQNLPPFSTLNDEVILMQLKLKEASLNKITENEYRQLFDKSIHILERIILQLNNAEINDGQFNNELRSFFLNKAKTKETVISVVNLYKTFRKSNFSLQGINFELKNGEILGILGENGNGKTTLLNILACELAYDHGTIYYPTILFNNSKSINYSKLKQEIAYVPQKIKDWGILDNVKTQLHFFASIKGFHGKANSRLVDFYLERFNLSEYKNYYWNELSGGFQLRFEIVKAIVKRPSLLLLDEPLANLDVKAQSILLNDLRKVSNSINHSMAIVISSQNLFDIEKVSDRILFLKKGTPLYYGLTKNVGLLSKFNVFQLDTDVDFEIIKSRLHTNKIIKFEEEGSYLMIYTDKSLDRDILLHNLLKAKIPIKLFRDISNSTRLLFESNPENYAKSN